MSFEPFKYCLNTSTIRGQELSLDSAIALAAKVGYQAIEPWIAEIDEHMRAGGSLADLVSQIRDLGLSLESAVAFFPWVVDDAKLRAQGMEQARRCMDMLAQLGGRYISAPPFGAQNDESIDLLQAAERYRMLLELGSEMGVVPLVELWGFSNNLSRLGEVALVAIESGHYQAALLLDVYHLFKGGSHHDSLKLLRGTSIGLFHFNDYPREPGRDLSRDADRVYPGDGVAPLGQILRDLNSIGYRGMLSLELFNQKYWKQDAERVLQTGLEKMRAAVKESLDLHHLRGVPPRKCG